MTDSLWSGLTDSYAGTPMGVTAENLAKKHEITREECDEFAVRSQRLWGEAKVRAALVVKRRVMSLVASPRVISSQPV